MIGIGLSLASTVGKNYIDSALAFNLPLKTSLVPQKAVGSATPTFTRATTATVADHEGVLRTVPSGCARMQGARYVRNLASGNSENISAAGWTLIGGATRSGADTLNMAATGDFIQTGITGDTAAGRTFTGSVTLSGSGTVQLDISATGMTPAVITLTTTPTRYSITAATTSGGGNLRIGRITSGTATQVIITKAQTEDVTGASITAPAEYVSVGVLAAPYHGAGADGCKYFDTLNGNTVASNVVTKATGAAIADATLDGYLAEGARTNLALQSDVLATQNVTVSAVANTLSFYGTGTVTLSGVSTSGPLVGTGANDRVTLTFTPTAGTLTLTVSGSVTKAQLEAGSFASSYIPTTTAAVTRNADVLAYVSAGNFSDTAGSVIATVEPARWSDSMRVVGAGNGVAAGTPLTIHGSTSGVSGYDTTTPFFGPAGTPSGTSKKVASKWGNGTMAAFVDGLKGTPVAYDGSWNLTGGIGIGIGGNVPIFGAIRNLRIYSRALPDSTLQGMTT